eukprot:scaffold85961_cov26-Tisochrysis_lutea.AAC.7
MIANFLVLSVPRYWIQTLAAPQLVPQGTQKLGREGAMANHRTGRKLQWIKHPEIPLKGDTEKGPHLGLGLLDWKNHVKALQAKWILNYLDARQAQWKQILDAWFCHTRLGRAAVLADVPAHKLTDGIKGRSKLGTYPCRNIHARRPEYNRSTLVFPPGAPRNSAARRACLDAIRRLRVRRAFIR